MEETKIEGKIRKVSDEVCKGCSQLFDGDCRAFSTPHSHEEYLERKSGKINCDFHNYKGEAR